MKRIEFLVVLIVFFFLQAVLAGRMSIGSISPDFPLLIVVYFAVHKNSFQGAILGFVVGLLQDLFNPSFLGLNAFTKTLTGYGLGLAGSKTERDNWLFLLALFGVAAMAHDFVYLLIFTGLHPGKFFVMWVTVSIPSAVYTAVVGVVVHALVSYSATEVVRYLGKARS
ncbi:MAG: rod shape-determining protein MreD [Candidatus Latescibacterota bacterium]|nr:MAG: rod shape-determining protein MreD [Candidatus Latescibacterota bacterium]